MIPNRHRLRRRSFRSTNLPAPNQSRDDELQLHGGEPHAHACAASARPGEEGLAHRGQVGAGAQPAGGVEFVGGREDDGVAVESVGLHGDDGLQKRQRCSLAFRFQSYAV